MLPSVTVLANTMNVPGAAVRLRTALSYGVRLGELEKLRQQLDSLETALPFWAEDRSR